MNRIVLFFSEIDELQSNIKLISLYSMNDINRNLFWQSALHSFFIKTSKIGP